MIKIEPPKSSSDNNKPKRKWQNEVMQVASEHGKLPPQAVELEESVIGAVLLDKEAVFQVLDVLSPETFYKPVHQTIFRAITKLAEEDEPIDILTITEELRKKGELDNVGGPYYLSQLTSSVISAAHIEFHARIIAQKHIQRELIRASNEIQRRAFDDSTDVDDLLDYSEQELFNIAYGNVKKETSSIDSIIQESLRLIEEASKRTDGLSGVPCGFSDLDRVTSGWQPSDLVIIAARPSMGKTAFVLSMTRNIAVEHKRAVAIFSLEMANVQLVNRLIVAETGLSSDKVKTGKLEQYEWEQLEYKIKDLAEAPIYCDDTPAISVFELRAKCRRLKMKYDIQLVIVDYLQLMTGSSDSGSREQEVSNISRGLKTIAKELNIPIIALSQLNRSVEMRTGDKRPQLSDLRESGAIEQDADIVMFIHRPERMGLLEDSEGNSTKGLAEIIIAKHRNGEVCDVKMRFIGEQARFADWDESSLSDLGGGDVMTMSSSMNQEDDMPAQSDFFSPKNESDVPF